MAWIFRSVMPTNLYGSGDNYHPEQSHVIPALLRRFHEAKAKNLPEVTLWGSGNPKREFLYVDDVASASVYVMNLGIEVYREHTDPMVSHINVGCGTDVTIKELAEKVAELTSYHGRIGFDLTKLDGAPRKLMDSSRLSFLGWHPTVTLDEGLSLAYADFLENNKHLRLG